MGNYRTIKSGKIYSSVGITALITIYFNFRNSPGANIEIGHLDFQPATLILMKGGGKSLKLSEEKNVCERGITFPLHLIIRNR